MPKFKVYAERTETLCAIIEADSAEDAEEAADQNYSYHDWSETNGSLSTEILFGDTVEEEEEEEEEDE